METMNEAMSQLNFQRGVVWALSEVEREISVDDTQEIFDFVTERLTQAEREVRVHERDVRILAQSGA